MIWLKAKRLKHPELVSFSSTFQPVTVWTHCMYYILKVWSRTRENTRSARMLANYRKDHSIPLIVSLLDNHMIWSAHVTMMTGLRRVLEYSAFTKIISCLLVCFFFISQNSRQGTKVWKAVTTLCSKLEKCQPRGQ